MGEAGGGGRWPTEGRPSPGRTREAGKLIDSGAAHSAKEEE